jgi:hypothetical protein
MTDHETAAATLPPGIHRDISEDRYHGDPCPEPSLSASLATILLEQSPRHAWHAHPRLNPQPPAEAPSRAMDTGSAIHKLILGKGRDLEVVQAADYRTAEARKVRDAARAAGKTPLLVADLEAAEATAIAVQEQLAQTEVGRLLEDGIPEATLVWQEPIGAWCRARVDFLPAHALDGGHVTLIDLKTTTGSALPERWATTGFGLGVDVQSAFYARGLRRLVPGVRSVRFIFVVIEQDPPHAVSLVELSGEAEAQGEQAVETAIRTWQACLKRNEWPAYPPTPQVIEPAPYRSTFRHFRNSALLDQLAAWQAPLDRDGGKP